MNFIDLIILVVVLGTLGYIAYFNFVKKDKDMCRSCPYKKDNCNCGNKKQKLNIKIYLTYNGKGSILYLT